MTDAVREPPCPTGQPLISVPRDTAEFLPLPGTARTVQKTMVSLRDRARRRPPLREEDIQRTVFDHLRWRGAPGDSARVPVSPMSSSSIKAAATRSS